MRNKPFCLLRIVLHKSSVNLKVPVRTLFRYPVRIFDPVDPPQRIVNALL